MSESIGSEPGPEWFCALLDTAPDVYFRYALVPARRFVYLSPAVKALTGRTPDEFYLDPALCLALVPREDRRILRQVLRARRGLTLTFRLVRGGATLRIELTTVVVTHRRQIVAIEGMARLAGGAGQSSSSRLPDGAPADLPTQQRLAALMYEVHDLLHRVLPPASSARPPGSVAAPVRVGNLVFDPARLAVAEGGTPVALTSREMLVLRYFLARSGQVVTRASLLQEVWGYRYTGDDRTVDVHVSRLRKKLPSLRERLVAIKHVGYRLDVEADVKIANC